MWDLRLANPFGSLSIRKFLVFVAAVAVTVFAYILAAAPTTYAADASWQGSTIKYDGKTYSAMPDAKDGDGLDLPAGSKVYASIDDAKTTPRKAYVIYFAPGSDPGKATEANLATYAFADPNKFSDKQEGKTLSLDPQGEGEKTEGTTSCVYEGIGWIVCPVTNFIANAVDKLYSILADFLTVRPLQVTEDNSLYRSWAVMRGFANVAFVIGFMVIIYSQLTNVGLSNYNVKRMLPRLIIAAILVNVSYWVCAIAIDISNILGYSLQNIFMALRSQVANVDHNSWDVVNFKDVTTLVLSGGTLGVAAWLSVAAAGGVLGALYFLGPVLLGVLLAALVAVVIMAVRQAIITILVILAPLAFVAYLLPNTEKYFEKWKDLFTTMLVMFPIFSVLFGGSQFAGTAIIQNSSSIIMIILGMAVQVAPLVLLPFLIKFSGGLLGRIGGVVNNKSKGILDKSKELAQQKSDLRKSQVMARNNLRRRNVMARTIQGLENGRLNREDEIKANKTEAEINRLGSAKYQQLHQAQANADLRKQARQAELDTNLANNATYRALHDANEQAEMRKKISQTNMETDHIGSAAYRNLHGAQERADMRKHIAEGELEQHFEHEKLTDAETQGLELQARATKLSVDVAKAKVDTNWEELKSGNARSIVTPESLSLSALMDVARSHNNFANEVRDLSRDAALTGYREEAAKRQQAQEISQSLLANNATIDGENIRAYAGGIMGSKGAESALAKAVTIERQEYDTNVQNKRHLIKHFNVDGTGRQNIAMMNENVNAVDSKGNRYTFRMDDNFAVEAAIEAQLSGEGNAEQAEQIVAVSGSKLREYKTSISTLMAKNKLSDKSAYLAGKTIDDVAQGKIQSAADLDLVALRSIAQGKIKPSQLATMDLAGITRIRDVITNPLPPQNDHNKLLLSDGDRAKLQQQIQELSKSADEALTLPSLKGNVAQNVEPLLREIKDLSPPSPPNP